MLRVNPVNRQELLKRLTFHLKSLVFKTVPVHWQDAAPALPRAGEFFIGVIIKRTYNICIITTFCKVLRKYIHY